MTQRFIRKAPHPRKIRPVGKHNIFVQEQKTVDINKTINEENTDMNNIEQLKAIVGDDVKIPKRKVKVEKKDKGLIERTEDSAILITEDNKMMLND